MIHFLNLNRAINRRRRSREECCWLGFAAGCAFTVIVFAVVTVITR